MKESDKVNGGIEVIGNCAYYRPVGKVTLEEAAGLLDQAIAHARDRRIPKLFINTKGLIGVRSPSLPERYFFVRQWAATGRGLVQVALTIHAEMIDPEKFGITVAHNAGFIADVFPEEPEAIAWLLSEPEP